MDEFYVGSTRRKQVTLKNIAGVLTDPTTLTFKIAVNGGTATTYVYGTDVEVVRASQGVYYVDYPNNAPGAYRLFVTATGTVHESISDEWFVKPSPV